MIHPFTTLLLFPGRKMIAIFYLDFLFKRRSKRDSSDEDEISDECVSVQAFLERYDIDEDAIKVHIAEPCMEYTSLDDYLDSHGVPKDAIKSLHEEKIADASHRRQARTIILWILSLQMLIIPIWLMVLLTLPIFNDKDSGKISERMQAGFLAAVATDFAGLYYIMTRDLFPQGSSGKPRRKKDEEDPEEE